MKLGLICDMIKCKLIELIKVPGQECLGTFYTNVLPKLAFLKTRTMSDIFVSANAEEDRAAPRDDGAAIRQGR